MAAKPKIAIVGAGRLGSALASALHRAGYRILEIISRDVSSSRTRARHLAASVKARAVTAKSARLHADLVWFCVPDREIATAARQLAPLADWKKKLVFHSSGALTSNELSALRARGASIASVHPLMTFVHRSVPSLRSVPFGIEGDAARAARKIVRDLGGEPFLVSPRKKVAYHAWGTLASPLLIAALVATEQVARLAGLSGKDARQKMLPIAQQTLTNYAALGPAAAFSGPLVRGDARIVAQHMKELRRTPALKDVYVSLARIALTHLPARERKKLQAALR